jgi:glycosyltransferase involved in cell wall biosynthesis
MGNKAKKILFVVTGLNYGGAEMQIWHLSRELTARHWQVQVVSMIPPGALLQRFLDDGIPVHDLRMVRGIPSPWAVLRLARIVQRFSPDIVHSHMVHANLLSRAARCSFPRTPLLNTGQNTNEGSRWRYYAYRYTDILCDRFHTVSRIALDGYMRGRFVSSHKLFYLPNGMAIEQHPLAAAEKKKLREKLGLEEDFAFLSVGRLEPQKNHQGLLHAFAEVAERCSARLLIVGEGAQANELEAYCSKLGLSHRVRFFGKRHDVQELMCAVDALVISSAWEGLPIVLLEAGVAALPVVSTSVGDIPLVIENGRSALLVRPGDSDALAQAMREMHNLSPSERAQLGTNLRATVVEQFDMRKIVDRWERVYEDLLS